MRVVPDSKTKVDADPLPVGERNSGERVAGTVTGARTRAEEAHAASDPRSRAEEARASTADALLRDGARALAPLAGDDSVYALLASARHELRSPLQSIQGFAELLGSESYGALSGDQHTFVQHILQGSLELGAVVEACLELAEVELIGRIMEPVRSDLRSALSDALDPAHNGTGTVVESHYAPAMQTVQVRFDRVLLRRGVHALLTALSSGPHKTFQARVELIQEHGRLLLTRSVPEGQLAGAASSDTKATESPEPLLSVSELARRRRATRSLIWLRLASALLALADAELRVSERLERAEVRFRLSSTH